MGGRKCKQIRHHHRSTDRRKQVQPGYGDTGLHVVEVYCRQELPRTSGTTGRKLRLRLREHHREEQRHAEERHQRHRSCSQGQRSHLQHQRHEDGWKPEDPEARHLRDLRRRKDEKGGGGIRPRRQQKIIYT